MRGQFNPFLRDCAVSYRTRRKLRIPAHTRGDYSRLMLVVTTNDIPGWEIQRVCGEVFGLTVRSRNAFAQMGAGFKRHVRR